MCADRRREQRSATRQAAMALTWLGGGHRRELSERYEQSAHALAGTIVLLGAGLAGLVAAFAVAVSTRWQMPLVVLIALTFALLIGAIVRSTINGPIHRGALRRGAVAVAVGVISGEVAAVVVFGGAIGNRLDEQAAQRAESAPAVAQASQDIGRLRTEQSALDDAVERAHDRLDEALVVARCEFNPTPACPPNLITGVPGAGPETGTANERLASAEQELHNAIAARDSRSPELSTEITNTERSLARTREAAIAGADRSLGTRWTTMQEYTLAHAAALLVRLLVIAFFVLLCLLPLVLKRWRGETSHERGAAVHAERARAESKADTQIAVKRAEVRAAVEILWADQELASARLAVQAQNEIDRARHRRRVLDEIDDPIPVSSQRYFQRMEDDGDLPIANDAPSAAPLPPGVQADRGTARNLPTNIESARVDTTRDDGGNRLIPTIPDVTRAATRWIRPLVPPLVERVFETATQPVRGARQVFEEVEEITFAFRRRHTVRVDSEHSGERPSAGASVPGGVTGDAHRIDASLVRGAADNGEPCTPLADLSPTAEQELERRHRPTELRGAAGPLGLPPVD